MPDLPEVEQTFVADVTQYLAGLQAMIQEGREFIEMTEEEVVVVEELQHAIDDLESKVVVIDLEVRGTDPGDWSTEALATQVVDWGRFTEEQLDLLQYHMDAARQAMASLGEEAEQTGSDLDVLGMQAQVASRNWGELTETQFAWAKGAVADQLAAAALAEELTGMAPSAERFGAGLDYIYSEAQKLDFGLRVLSDEAGPVGETFSIWYLGSLDAAAATRQAGQAADNAGHQFRIWGTGITFSSYALHWMIAGSIEFLAVAVPALVAFGSAAMVAAQAATWMGDQLEGTYTATEATSSMIGETTGQVYGLKSALQQAQNASDPQVYELLGASVNFAKTSFGGFWTSGSQVIDMMDRLGAEIDIDMQSAFGATAQGLLSHMVADLTALGEVFGNLGHAILQLAGDMPGLAEVILGVLAGLSKLLEILVNFFSMVQIGGVSIITFAMALEEAGRWGGLLLNMFDGLVSGIGGLITKVGLGVAEMTEFEGAGMAVGEAMVGAGGAVEKLGASMTEAGAMTKTLGGTFKMLFTTGWGWAIIGAVTLGILVEKMLDTGDAAEQMASEMENAIGKASVTQGLTDILQDLPKLQQSLVAPVEALKQLSDATNSAGASLEKQHGETTSAVDSLNQLALAGVNADMHEGALRNTTETLTTAQNKLINQFADAMTMTQKFNGVTYSLADTLGLASAAGLNLNTMFNKQGQITEVARQQILNLIQGYQNMAQTGSTLGNDINAVTVQLMEQQTKVQGLNQAWDSFMTGVTGGTNSLATLNSDLITMGNVTTNATSKITAYAQQQQGLSLSTGQIAQALKSFSGTSAQVWQNYDASLTQAEQVTDWLRTAASEGMVTNTQYSESVKGVVAELLPYAKSSSTAVSELSALAQEAGGPATANYKTLKDWVGNTKTAQDALNDTVKTATGLMANLANVAANLSSTLDSTVDSALAQGTVNIKGIANATQAFSQDLRTNGINASSTKGAIASLANQLHASGENAQTTAQIIYALTLRLTGNAKEAQAAADEVLFLARSWNQVPANKSTTYDIYTNNIVTNSTRTTVGGGPAPRMARGGLVPGQGRGDTVPAMLEPGEAVVPRHLVPSVAPYLRSRGVPGFATGTTSVPPMFWGGGGVDEYPIGVGHEGRPLHIHLEMDGRSLADAVVPAMVGATARYNIRNSGRVTGVLRPATGRS
jgi:hypothetical protein